MSRVSKAKVHAQFDKAAQMILDAAGRDGRTSRADMAKKLKTLEGTEKAFVNNFFRITDHLERKPGGQVTKKDVENALSYAKNTMVDSYDIDENGLSTSEIADMSNTAQMAVKLATAE
jgi:hypothetical protein